MPMLEQPAQPAKARGLRIDWRALAASRWLWCLGAVLIIAALELAQGFASLSTFLGDTDDATRLYEIRQLMVTGAWFDMTLPRIGGPTPLISHWSRLIDVPLILLLQVFGRFASPPNAELAVRIMWPLLVLFVFLRILVRAAECQGGRTAAILLLCLSLTCLTGLYQFHIGRIDHHNGMIMGSVGGMLLLLDARRNPREGTLAGVLIGIGLAIGYEPLAFVLPVLGVAALMAVIDLDWLPGVRKMAVTLAATLAIVFVATVAPPLWFAARCDALSLNMVLLAGCGAAGLTVIDARARDVQTVQRVGILAAAGALGLVLYSAMDTRCLAGPFGQIDPAINAIWLDHVTESANLLVYFGLNPLLVVAFAATALTGLAMAYDRWRRLRTPEARALVCLLVITVPAGVWMNKLVPYASWIAVFSMALWLSRVRPAGQLSVLSKQVLGIFATSQWAAMVVALPLLLGSGAVAPELIDANTEIDDKPCMTTPAIRSLQPLPKGFVVGATDFGAFIVALTHHDVLAAPYHRIDKAILLNQTILGAKPAEAKRLLAQVHADYVVLCLHRPGAQQLIVGGKIEMPADGIEALLRAGEIPDFLVPVAIDSPVPELKIWRVLR